MKAAAEHGAYAAGYTIVRLNGTIGDIFYDWLHKNYPDRADKVWNQICECHGGKSKRQFSGTRMHGEGKVAEAITQLFRMAKKKYLKPHGFEYDMNAFHGAVCPWATGAYF